MQLMLKKFQYHTAVKDSGYLKLLVADIAAKGGNEFFSWMMGVDNFYFFLLFIYFCLFKNKIKTAYIYSGCLCFMLYFAQI